MSSTRKKSFEDRELIPAVFCASMVSMGIRPMPKNKCKDAEKSHGDSSSLERKKGNDTSTAISKSTDENPFHSVVFTDGAFEVLRKYHGQFIKVLTDGIVASKEGSHTSSRKRKREKDSVQDCEGGDLQQTERKMIVTDKTVKASLHAMKLSRVLSEFEDNHLSQSGRNTVKNGVMATDTELNNSMTLDEKRRHAKLKRQRMKRAFKDLEASDDLLKEQERLIASSTARTKNTASK